MNRILRKIIGWAIVIFSIAGLPSFVLGIEWFCMCIAILLGFIVLSIVVIFCNFGLDLLQGKTFKKAWFNVKSWHIIKYFCGGDADE